MASPAFTKRDPSPAPLRPVDPVTEEEVDAAIEADTFPGLNRDQIRSNLQNFRRIEVLETNPQSLAKAQLENFEFIGSGQEASFADFEKRIQALAGEQDRLVRANVAPGRKGTILTERRSLLS